MTEAWAPIEQNTRNGSYGSRVVFARDGTLFFSVGDRQQSVAVKDVRRAQDLTDDAGKVLRLRDVEASRTRIHSTTRAAGGDRSTRTC